METKQRALLQKMLEYIKEWCIDLVWEQGIDIVIVNTLSEYDESIQDLANEYELNADDLRNDFYCWLSQSITFNVDIKQSDLGDIE